MSFTLQDPDSLARELALRDPEDPAPAWAGVARLIRVASGRWGVARRLELKRHAVELCCAAGFAEEVAAQRVEATLDLLVELRDLEAATVAAATPEPEEEEPEGLDEEAGDRPEPTRRAPAGRYLAPALPRLVRCGGLDLLSGPFEELAPALGAPRAARGPASVARWAPAGQLTPEALAERGVAVWALTDWLGVPGHHEPQRRWRQRLSPERDEEPAGELPSLWKILDDSLDQLGMPASEDTQPWLLAGPPGGLFGRPGAGGRWWAPERTPDGRWCAALAGHHERHWRSGLAEVRSGVVTRWLELFDWDELWWAHLSRAARTGPRERMNVVDGEIRLQTALPRQLRRLGALGAREGWRWGLPAEVREAVGSVLRERAGVECRAAV